MEIKNEKEFAELFDHTNLKPSSSINDIKKLCNEAKEYKFGAVCINPCFVKAAIEFLKGSSVKVCTVIGFPLGVTTTETKAFEAKQAINNGADEIDMVINIGALKDNDDEFVKNDIMSVVKVANGIIVKVILETCYLEEEEIIRACKISKEAGANFVKTSTGFGSAGAKVEHIKLMRETVGSEMGVKASGGIRDLETALKMLRAGASRIGASASVKIIKEYRESLKNF
ncbi:MAG: deoxyribose-phosphate aldolase [Promethearchaeota archaeon]